MGQIKLNGLEFYAYHGCLQEEQVIGNNFVVDITMDTEMQKASCSDDLSDALNYAEAYEIVKQEMLVRSNLLEHLCRRILDKLFESFEQLNWAQVCVTKLKPPIDGKMQSVTICQQSFREIH